MWLTLLARYWYVLAIAAIAAWGGIGWYGKQTAENDLLAQQLAAARVISAQLEENQRLSDQRNKRGAEISDAFQKGRRDAEEDFKPVKAEVAQLHDLFPAPGLVRPAAQPDGSTVPGTAYRAGGPDATACTDQPGRIVDAADRVVEDLAVCADTARQLTSLQTWVRDVCQAKPP